MLGLAQSKRVREWQSVRDGTACAPDATPEAAQWPWKAGYLQLFVRATFVTDQVKFRTWRNTFRQYVSNFTGNYAYFPGDRLKVCSQVQKQSLRFSFRPAISSDVANIGRELGRLRLVKFTGRASWTAIVHADIRQTKRQQIQLDLVGHKNCS